MPILEKIHEAIDKCEKCRKLGEEGLCKKHLKMQREYWAKHKTPEEKREELKEKSELIAEVHGKRVYLSPMVKKQIEEMNLTPEEKRKLIDKIIEKLAERGEK